MLMGLNEAVSFVKTLQIRSFFPKALVDIRVSRLLPKLIIFTASVVEFRYQLAIFRDAQGITESLL